MLVSKAVIGGEIILIEADENSVEVVNDATDRGERLTVPTGVGDRLVNAYEKAKSAIFEIAKDFAGQLQAGLVPGQKVELEFGLSLSAGGSVWVISGKADCALKVKMTWEAR